MSDKTIEEMAHDYAVAQIQSGKPVKRDDIEFFCDIASDLKQVARKVQKDITEYESRRRW